MQNLLIRTSLVISALLISMTAQNTFAQSSSEGLGTEIPVQGVFAPKHGFDDNDNVQIIVDGILPNACYKKSQTLYSVDALAHTITVQQYADPANLPEELKMQIPFMADVEVGNLEQGEYTIIYKSLNGEAHKTLFIDKASSTTIDNLYYAITTDIYSPSEVSVNSSTIKLVISGFLNSSCTVIDKLDVQFVDDTIVILPQVKKTHNYCMPVAKDFVNEVYIKTPPAGRYQVHVRSVNGSAVNRLFSVK
jgi:hypothetical protein